MNNKSSSYAHVRLPGLRQLMYTEKERSERKRNEQLDYQKQIILEEYREVRG